MLDEEQRRTVVEMFGSGKSVSEISRKVGVSRPSVYRVIASDVEKDAEVLSLKKELRKTELRKKIEELRAPRIKRMELDELRKVIDGLISKVLFLWNLSSKTGEESPGCLYCGGSLEYYERKEPSGTFTPGYKCDRCRRSFPFP